MSDIVKICKKHGELTASLTRFTSNGKMIVRICVLCSREKSKKCRDKNPEKEKLRRKSQYIKHRERDIEYSKRYKQENKEQVKATRRAYGIKNKDKIKDNILKHKFNISIEQYNKMLDSQNHVCAICFQPEKAKVRGADYLKSLAVDHCHTTNKIRGLLCDICNKGIGHFNDSIEKLEKAILYLKKYTI